MGEAFGLPFLTNTKMIQVKKEAAEMSVIFLLKGNKANQMLQVKIGEMTDEQKKEYIRLNFALPAPNPILLEVFNNTFAELRAWAFNDVAERKIGKPKKAETNEENEN